MKDPYYLIKEKREPIPGNYMHVLDPKKGLKPGLKFTLNRSSSYGGEIVQESRLSL